MLLNCFWIAKCSFMFRESPYTTCIVEYRIYMIYFKGLLFLMLNPLFLWFTVGIDEFMHLSQTGKETCVFLFNRNVFLSEGKNCGWKFAKWIAKKSTYCVSSTFQMHQTSKMHSACWVKITMLWIGCCKLSLQYYDVNLICIPTLQFERTMWHLPECKVGGKCVIL